MIIPENNLKKYLYISFAIALCVIVSIGAYKIIRNYNNKDILIQVAVYPQGPSVVSYYFSIKNDGILIASSGIRRNEKLGSRPFLKEVWETQETSLTRQEFETIVLLAEDAFNRKLRLNLRGHDSWYFIVKYRNMIQKELFLPIEIYETHNALYQELGKPTFSEEYKKALLLVEAIIEKSPIPVNMK